jgi:hypothetical protein
MVTNKNLIILLSLLVVLVFGCGATTQPKIPVDMASAIPGEF